MSADKKQLLDARADLMRVLKLFRSSSDVPMSGLIALAQAQIQVIDAMLGLKSE